MEWPEAKLARLVKVLGAISQDGLSISGVPIAEITRRVSTPCYVYSGEAIIAQIQRVASVLRRTPVWACANSSRGRA